MGWRVIALQTSQKKWCTLDLEGQKFVYMIEKHLYANVYCYCCDIRNKSGCGAAGEIHLMPIRFQWHDLHSFDFRNFLSERYRYWNRLD